MSVDYSSPTRGHGIEARDAGFAILSRLNRWLVAGAVGAAGALSLLAANSFQGKEAATVTPRRASSGVRSGVSNVQSAPGVQSAPAPVPVTPVPVAPAPVVSGGS